MAKKVKSPLSVRLRSGESLQIESLGMSGYVTHPMGALILGGEKSSDLVGKFCVGVCYEDGRRGLIAQEEILEIVDAKGRSVSYGNARYPGHPNFDPRDGFDPLGDQMEALQRISLEKEKQRKRIEEKGLAAVLEEELKKYNFDSKKKKSKKKKSGKKKSGKKKSGKKKSGKKKSGKKKSSS